DPEDAFAVWDNQTNDYYTASDGTVRTFSREEAAEQFLAGLEPQEIKADRQEEPAQETAAPAADEPGLFTRNPLASAYGVGDFVFLGDTEYRITDLQQGYVQLNAPALAYPIYRTESKEQFERAIRQDPRNSAITDYLPADLDQFSSDLREVLTGEGGLLDGLAKEDIAVLLRSGAGNPAVAQHLSQRFSGTVETMQLETG
ncbi:hypothetical protein MKD02_22495, partial [[Clostridium] innocuum]|nr:hypothetical protein [[Clostridium] innocuum]